jgi:hypothetical protein
VRNPIARRDVLVALALGLVVPLLALLFTPATGAALSA